MFYNTDYNVYKIFHAISKHVLTLVLNVLEYLSLNILAADLQLCNNTGFLLLNCGSVLLIYKRDGFSWKTKLKQLYSLSSYKLWSCITNI